MIICGRHGFYDCSIFVKCDCCGKKELVIDDQSDKTLAHDWIHEHGWKNMKKGDKWLQICDECKSAMEKAKRDKFIADCLQ